MLLVLMLVVVVLVMYFASAAVGRIEEPEAHSTCYVTLCGGEDLGRGGDLHRLRPQQLTNTTVLNSYAAAIAPSQPV